MSHRHRASNGRHNPRGCRSRVVPACTASPVARRRARARAPKSERGNGSHSETALSTNSRGASAYGLWVDLAASRRLARNPHLRALMGAWTAFGIGTAGHAVLVVVF